MFHSARIKLTAWYLLIIVLISSLFSFALYKVIGNELERFARVQRVRIENQINGDDTPPESRIRPSVIDPDLIIDAKNRLAFILISIDAGIFIMSGAVSYLLAGRTLKPIKEMVDEQNRFTADASHELRTPLTSLKSTIEVNLRDKSLTLAEAKSLLRSNLEEVNHLESLSDALLQLAKYQVINNKKHFEKLWIPDIIDKAVKKVEPQASAKQITITKKLVKQQLQGDLDSLSKLFITLLENSIKYSPKGSEILVSSKAFDSVIEISVSDTGIGISEEDLPFIFNRFYRADRSRAKGKIPGYGLGLSIAKKIVESHSGTINVKSGKSKGTTFTVILPTQKSR